MYTKNKINYLNWILLAGIGIGCNSQASPETKPSGDSTLTKTNAPAETPISIEGDFNGDARRETLTLVITDQQGNPMRRDEVTAKLDADMNWVGKGKLVSSDASITPLMIEGDFIGLISLINEGEFDGDKADEISMVRDWATSNIRDIEVFSYKKGQWAKRAAVMINIGMMEGAGLTFDKLVEPHPAMGKARVQEYTADGDFVPKNVDLAGDGEL